MNWPNWRKYKHNGLPKNIRTNTVAIEIVEITNGADKSRACEQLTQLLPTWFGQPEANAHYAREIATKDVFGAVDG